VGGVDGRFVGADRRRDARAVAVDVADVDAADGADLRLVGSRTGTCLGPLPPVPLRGHRRHSGWDRSTWRLRSWL
jgi:hypothetical protein